MGFRSTITDQLPEKSTAKISATIVDENNVAIPLASLTTLTLTLYDELTNTIINAKDDTSIVNVNGGTFSATSGAMTYELTPLDNAIIGTACDVEKHVALIEWSYNTGTKQGRHEIILQIKNLNRVT